MDIRRAELAERLPPAEERELLASLAAEIPRLIKEIRLKAGRRLKRSRRGRLWSARLMRANLGTEGIPFVIPYRRRRPSRPRVAVMADVSWSVQKASALFLAIAREFLRKSRKTSVHLFVDRCVDATEAISTWEAGDLESFHALLDSLPDLDPNAPSDYGRAFYQASRGEGSGRGATARLRIGRRDTVLVVLGDARSNFRDPQGWAFADLAASCRRVIWLNPEPASLWNTGDSVLSEYLPSCHLLCEARDLDGIARGVLEMVRSL